jgi:endonuclease/exonuclease/phosphatase (EEP) superfamily protein YafD
MSLAEGNSSGAAPARRRSAVLTVLRAILVLAVLALLGVSVGALLSTLVPSFVLLTPFAPQVTVLALVAVVVGLLLGLRRWVLVPAALAFWQGALLLPFLWPAAATPVSGQPLHVISLNLWLANPVPQQTIDYLLASDADVIATVETTPEWRQRLKVLNAKYPYHIDCQTTPFRCGVALFSKRPFQSSFIGPVESGSLPVVGWVTIDWEGKPLTLAALQILNPRIGLQRGFQAVQGEAMTRYFANFGGDVVLMGDFNSVPWGPLQRELRAGTAFDNRGRLAFTWPSWAPAIFRLPIDQIFVEGALAVRNYRAGPSAGSDHLPVLADIYRTSP